ncbi:hypothetical protein VWS40_002485 [Cronobacter sakazakii]|nr:hypothetical protein [Cronobacter sakazakii]EME2018050.1 hypothetical protein [Cronobacter sakazakii]EME2019449.1 hypothetical protein [Cronobacter sakazakii]EME2073676.1 hypothetical protein [Cronobacter sakazakii]
MMIASSAVRRRCAALSVKRRGDEKGNTHSGNVLPVCGLAEILFFQDKRAVVNRFMHRACRRFAIARLKRFQQIIIITLY